MDVRKLLWALLLGWAISIPQALSQTPLSGFTIPSADITLSFTQPGRLVELHCIEGKTINKGDLVAKLDDNIERVRLAQATAKTEDTTQIKASEASLEQKRLDLTKLEIAAQRNAATTLEVDHARLNVKIAELSLELAKFEHELTTYVRREAQGLVDRMQLTSPVSGLIEKSYVENGESVNALQEIVRIVKIDPLWIDASISIPVASNLKPNDQLNIRFPNTSGLQSATILHVAAVANETSPTLRVRIEVPNPSKRPAGEKVEILLNETQTR